jgi:hypothetical protein
MNKAYSRIDWEDYPSVKTPLGSYNLGKIDKATDEIDDRVITLDATKVNTVDIANTVKNIEYDEGTGIFTVTYYNGSSYTIDTKLEKLSINWDFDKESQKLLITLDDGTKQEVDLSALITEYEFINSDTIAFSIDDDGKVSAIVKEGSIEEKHLQPNYLADVKVEVAKAETSASAAGTSEQNAAESAQAAKEGAEKAAESEQNAKNTADGLIEKVDNATAEAAAAAKACEGIVDGLNTMIDSVTGTVCVLEIEDGILVIKEA